MQSTPSLKVHGLEAAAAAFTPRHALSGVVSGLIGGLLCIIFGISYGTLAFSGPLASHLSEGLAAGIVAALVLNLAAALNGSLPWAVAHAQPTAAVVIALMGASIARLVAPAELMPSALAMVALTSIFTGAFFFVLGRFRLGRLIRFVPFSVAGGFQAGIGWLMAVGSIKILTGTTVTLHSLDRLIDGTSMEHLLPAVLLAVALLITTRRSSHYLILPALLLASALLFYLVLAVAGVTTARAEAHGWLLGPLTRDGLYHPLTATDLHLVNWPAVIVQAGGIGTVMIVATIGLLLNVTRLEAAADHDLNVDRDLRALGIGNMVNGLAGGLPGFHSTTASLVVHGIGYGTRLVGIVAAGVAAVVLVSGAGLLADVPRLLVGGFLLFLGTQLLIQWVIQGWSTMGRLDYTVVLTILIVIGSRGFLVGTLVGIILAILIFVVAYSRAGVVKHELSGATYRSNVDRSPRQQQVLRERGDSISILTLQGFLFFGTSTNVLEQIRRRVDAAEQPPVRYVVLDCHLITGVDASLGLVFSKLRRLAVDHGVSLALAGMPRAMVQSVRPDVPMDRAGAVLQVFPDVDRAVEWCEDRILDEAQAWDDGRPLLAQLIELIQPPELADRLIGYLDRLVIPTGNQVVRQGEGPDSLYLVESGKLSVMLETPDGAQVHLRTVAAGALLGELGFYLGTPRTASVIAAEPSVLFRLTRESLHRMQVEDPPVAAAFGEFITRLLANRVVTANQTVAQLTS